MEKQTSNQQFNSRCKRKAGGLRMASKSQSNIFYSNESFRRYLMQLSTGLIWKNATKAREAENPDNAYLAELFITANRGLLSFDIIKSFPRIVLKNIGVSANLVEAYAADKNRIPENLREIAVNEYTRALTSKNSTTGRYEYFDTVSNSYVVIYDEKNNYYRMLMGLPNTDDTDLIYNTDQRWSTDTPIHQMSLIDRLEMEKEGVLDTIISNNPSKEYLKHLGAKSIDLFTARIAERFEILYRDSTDSTMLNDAFDMEYRRSSSLINSVYYSTAFRKSNGLYENFLAMCVLFITIQAMTYKYLQADITRDFYDAESIKLVYDSYQVPFYTYIPLEHHRMIIKNINRLISYKGSSQVIFDLFNIFDIGAMNIYTYFLTKIHKVDASGLPIFIPKLDEHGDPMYDDEGNMILDPSNYEVKFSQIGIYDDPALSISNVANTLEYNSVVSSDPYWVNDNELQEKLINDKFNYLESKYIGLQTVFDLMKITFENAYVFRLITDNKLTTERIPLFWTEAGTIPSLFAVFIYLAALFCRNYGYTGNITPHIPAIMDTLGYNFADAATILTNRVDTDPYLSANLELKNIMLALKQSITNLDSVMLSYDNIGELRTVIMNGFMNAKSRKEFFAYRDLYRVLMISKEITAVYTDPVTGEVYETFTDVLADASEDLMQRYLLLTDDEVGNEIQLVVAYVERFLTNLKYLRLTSGITSNAMIDSLIKMAEFFKSVKCELIGYNITYTMSLRGENFFKLIDVAKDWNDTYYARDTMSRRDRIKNINDILSRIKEIRTFIDKVKQSDERRVKDYRTYVDRVKLYDILLQKLSNDAFSLLNYLKSAEDSAYIGTSIQKLADRTDLLIEIPDSGVPFVVT
jgi:hypothetical protein